MKLVEEEKTLISFHSAFKMSSCVFCTTIKDGPELNKFHSRKFVFLLVRSIPSTNQHSLKKENFLVKIYRFIHTMLQVSFWCFLFSACIALGFGNPIEPTKVRRRPFTSYYFLLSRFLILCDFLLFPRRIQAVTIMN